jgi:hypothetical protein
MDQNNTQQTDSMAQAGTSVEPTAFTPPPSFNPFSQADPSAVVDSTAAPADASTAPTFSLPADDTTVADPVATTSTDTTSVADVPVADDLLDIKQDALSQLGPLVEHLDQTPEEKFRTTMMLIQATDDQSKIKDAYAAAKEITDPKAQAQALLDVVNEINYFTQQKQN